MGIRSAFNTLRDTWNSESSIPAPTDGRIIQAATRTVLSVRAGGDNTVVYYCDDNTATISVVPDRLDAADLDNVITQRYIPGQPVITAALSCGGVDRDDIDIHPDSNGQALAIEAIPHFYAEVRESPERAALRVAYRALTRA